MVLEAQESLTGALTEEWEEAALAQHHGQQTQQNSLCRCWNQNSRCAIWENAGNQRLMPSKAIAAAV